MIGVLRGLTGLVSRLFDLLMAPFASQPAVGMVLISVVSAAWALLLFKAVTPQQKLQTTRDHLFGHIYEMGLYQDHLGVLARIQGDLAKANLRYLSLTLPALLVLMIPMILTLGQLEGRFAHRPLRVGESTVLSIRVSDDLIPELPKVRLAADDGLKVLAGPVRNQRTGTVAWRVAVEKKGPRRLRFLLGDREIGSQELAVGQGLPNLHERSEHSALGVLLYPGEFDLSGSPGLVDLTMNWPDRETNYLGLDLNWLVAFMVFSMVAGLVLKDWLKVSL